MQVIKPSIEIIDMDDYEKIVKKSERIGRGCSNSEGKVTEDSAEKFIKGLLTRQHESVIEHENVTVRFVCDRGVTHEIVRHRIASYSQESTRYCNYSGDKFDNQITVIDLASGFQYDLSKENDKAKYEVWTKAMENAEQSYFRMLELGATPQEARSVLPNSLKTEIVVTMNLRSWRNFFRLRVDSHAHPQMREVATMLYEEFKKRLPVFVADLDIH